MNRGLSSAGLEAYSMSFRSPLALVLEQTLELSDLFVALQNEGALPTVNLGKRSRRCEDQVVGQAESSGK